MRGCTAWQYHLSDRYYYGRSDPTFDAHTDVLDRWTDAEGWTARQANKCKDVFGVHKEVTLVLLWQHAVCCQ
jgi:hypothetical protein